MNKDDVRLTPLQSTLLKAIRNGVRVTRIQVEPHKHIYVRKSMEGINKNVTREAHALLRKGLVQERGDSLHMPS